MNFSLTPEQENLKAKVAEFARQNLNDDMIKRDSDGIFSVDLWRRCAEFGIQGLAAPATLGGKYDEVDLLTAVFAMEGFGYGCKDNGLALALNAHMWTVQLPMIEFSTEAQKQKYIPRMVSGDLKSCHGLTEPNSGLGKEGAGFGIINHSLEYDRCCILASHLGAMERQLEDSISYVKERKQFGQSIGKFQSVSNRIADMKLRLETSRLLLYKTAWKKQTGTSAMMEASLLKLHISESFALSSLDAMRSMGGRSYLEENEIERDLRDAVGGLLYAGTSDIQRNIISRLLGV
ncbi:unnamed protein product [Cyprideis torosa]|uniref:Uncharacterized protein n=1 Tax=Cyprideis torosa TaxID=163714 RepID=A0A7R8WJX9_9CRUS|nr:unnamed protein product [Cyprideis torosa]CAG0900722.1 unnamed protein product [Cyprideis torosa]